MTPTTQSHLSNITLSKPQLIKLAIICAKRCLYHFKSVQPNNDQPRLAILSAEHYLTNPTAEVEAAARKAAVECMTALSSLPPGPARYAGLAAYHTADSVNSPSGLSALASANYCIIAMTEAMNRRYKELENAWLQDQISRIAGLK